MIRFWGLLRSQGLAMKEPPISGQRRRWRWGRRAHRAYRPMTPCAHPYIVLSGGPRNSLLPTAACAPSSAGRDERRQHTAFQSAAILIQQVHGGLIAICPSVPFMDDLQRTLCKFILRRVVFRRFDQRVAIEVEGEHARVMLHLKKIALIEAAIVIEQFTDATGARAGGPDAAQLYGLLSWHGAIVRGEQDAGRWIEQADRAGFGSLDYSAVVAHIRGRKATG
jgi:hypothetical protein